MCEYMRVCDLVILYKTGFVQLAVCKAQVYYQLTIYKVVSYQFH